MLTKVAVFSSLILGLSGCGTTDPALRQAIAEVQKQPHLARVKLRPFAEQGNETAIIQICIAYGRSMDTDVRGAERVQAYSWCQTAAEIGNPEAQYFLGRYYHWGIGTPENLKMALYWYTKSASQGFPEAEDAKRGMEGKPPVCKNWITGCKLF